MTNAKYASIAKTSPATEQRDLAELVNTGVLTLVGAGRGTRYDVQWDVQEPDVSYNDSPSP